MTGNTLTVDGGTWRSEAVSLRRRFPIATIAAEILASVPEDELAKPSPVRDPGIAAGNSTRVTISTRRR